MNSRGFPRDYLLQAYGLTCLTTQRAAIKNRFLSSLQREGQAAHLEGSIELLDATFLENMRAERKRRIERAEGAAGLSRPPGARRAHCYERL